MISRSVVICLALLCAFCAHGTAQIVQVRPTGNILDIPTLADGNSPTFWRDGAFHLLTSTGSNPVIIRGNDQFSLGYPESVTVAPADHYPIWIESAWVDDDGTVFGWYHHEPHGLCGGKSDMTAPEIGAAISLDGGNTFEDLGLVLTSGAPNNCNAGNGIFAGGHGDFSVILDRERSHFYFLFTNYAGDASEQGIVIARMAFQDRTSPSGSVFKYYAGQWNEPGLGGHMTPVFPARVSWQKSDTDSYWGPAVHWNHYLQTYVVLLNHSCCSPRWPQEGIYVSFSPDLSNPGSWKAPSRILRGKDINWSSGYYPQVIGLGPNETDTEAGEVSRLWIQGRSKWEIIFIPEPPPDENPEPTEPFPYDQR